jgi:1-phosphofructokinase family hexose kinase
VLVVCPNLALDRTLEVGALERGRVVRAASVVAEAGGKGVNAARIARALGADPVVVGFVGGAVGDAVRRLLARDSLRAELVEVVGETRVTFALVEADSTVTLVNEPGPTISADDCGRLLETVIRRARPREPVLLAGSLPPGAPDDFYASLVEALPARVVVVDASGVALRRTLACQPFLVKPNADEAAEFGTDPSAAAVALVAGGARHALVTLGPEGAVLASGSDILHARPAPVAAVNPTGSGDALAGGLLTALEAGSPLKQALRFGLAAAAASTLHRTAGRIDPTRVAELEEAVELAKATYSPGVA